MDIHIKKIYLFLFIPFLSFSNILFPLSAKNGKAEESSSEEESSDEEEEKPAAAPAGMLSPLKC